MSLADLSEPIVVNRADGTSITLKRCPKSDRFKFRAVFRTYRKYWLAESLRILGITGTAAVQYFNELDARRLRDKDVDEFVNTLEGQREAVLMSLRIDNPKAEMDAVDALDLNDSELLEAAAGVFNMRIVSETGPFDGAAAGTTTQTSSPTPPSSESTSTQPTTP